MRAVAALPSRTLVPLLLVLFALLLGVVNNLLQVREYRVLVEQEQSHALTERLGVEQATLDRLIVNGNLLQLRRVVAELGLRPYLTHAYLIAPGGRVVGSLARADVGQDRIDRVIDAEGAALLDLPVQPDQALQIERSPDGRALLAALILDSGHRLLVRSDLELPLAQRLHASRLELWRHAATILLSALVLALFLHVFWLRRAQRLSEAARAIGRGHLDTRVNIGGRDELALVASAFNDMALRLQAQHDALRDGERRMRAMFELAGAGVARIDTLRGRFIEVNARFCDIAGHGREDLLAFDFMQITHPDDLPAELEKMDALRRGRIREFSMDKRLCHPDGRTVWVTLSVTPLWAPDERPDFHIAVVQDITARHDAEEALMLERNRLRAAERIAGLGSWEFHPGSGRVWWSAQMFSLFGMAPANRAPTMEVFMACLHPEDRTAVAVVLEQMKAGAQTLTALSYRTSPECGPVRHLLPSAQVVTDGEGRVIKYAGTLIDTTEAVQAERALRASEERLRATLEHAPNVAVQWFDRDGRVLYWNHASATLYGWAIDEAIGRRIGELVLSEQDARAFMARLESVQRDSLRIGPEEFTVRHRDGTLRYVESSTFSIPGVDGDAIFVCMDVDITARRQAEQAVEKERTHLRTLFAALPDMVWLKSPEGRFLSCNRMTERVLGLREDELVGKTDYDLFPRELADSFRAHDEMAKRTGGRHINEEWITVRDTGERILVQTVKLPMLSEAGELKGVLGIARNITQLHEAQEDLRALNGELEQRVAERTRALSDAMKELESFSYAVSHDLKAPLRGIDGYSRILQEDYGDLLDDQARRFLGNIRNGASQMHALIEDLLAYSRMERRSLESSRVDLGELVQSVLARRADELAAAAVQVVGEVPSLIVRADRQGLDLVLRNLIDNALKFSRDAKPPVISFTTRVDGDRITLSIRDNGIGFDMKYHERIFEIFQRLHRSDEFAGTGVGLALVRKAMQRMGGRVWAESAPGEGACFNLELPA
ncbi:PAS domain S-box protein [Methyloversatilis universalis]|uniref:PAS domain S-box protein n=1 Tax=Methyloversatilis universalis TaxID=378211 RepID=UPI00036F640F|nr:PAS domain S-box protein [Methyloversatilis universalis]